LYGFDKRKLTDYKQVINVVKEIVADEEEPFKSMAFEIILSRLLRTVDLESNSASSVKNRKNPTSVKEKAIQVEGPSNQQIIEFEIPESIKEVILSLPERKRIPLLWNFSTKKSMTIREFLEAAAKNNIPLSHTWLPSEGSNFAKRIVRDEKMLEEDGKVGREIKYKIGDVGNLKIRKIIAEIEAQKERR
jgi:hypothetical protein